MSGTLQAVRGMNDVVPADAARWRALEHHLLGVLSAYGYAEVRLPIVEQTAVFHRSIGDVTDIVQKEMYSFDDRNGDNLSLRPEGTAGCVRAVLQHGLLSQLPLRLWYLGPMFRHERPQRGRHRQFHQLGVEVFGAAGPDIDAEVILLSARMWRSLGLSNLRLQLNSLGTSSVRMEYRTALADYFDAHREQLDDDGRERLSRNALRILDSKDPALRPLIDRAPTLADYLDPESRAHFEALCGLLDAAGVGYTINRHLVRGLDYYSKTVFEWISDDLGAQATVCAGGRYDGLVELMGGKPTPAIGFALGLERLPEPGVAIYVTATADAFDAAALHLAERLRDARPGWRVQTHVGGGSLKARMKRADRSGARVALLLGETEVAQDEVTVKPLRDRHDQITCRSADLVAVLAPLLGG
jgi:histidyl-tRNA synthetase